MKRRDASDADSAGGAAADWFVRLDAGEAGAEDAFAAWLAERGENETALERVELAAALGKRLAADPSGALGAEAARVARGAWRSRQAWSRTLAWSGALAAASLLVAAFVFRGGGGLAPAAEIRTIEAARAVTFDAPRTSVALLPGGVVVDAGAVAVLPFTTGGDGVVAERLERDVAAVLETVPGLYVIAGDAVQPYSGTELAAPEIGRQLGARGIVEAAVELVDGRVLVNARLRDSTTGATVWRADVDRPVDELGAIRYEIAESVAATMFDSDLREQAARAGRSSEPVSPSKPLPQ